jgi:hypothetical protein
MDIPLLDFYPYEREVFSDISAPASAGTFSVRNAPERPGKTAGFLRDISIKFYVVSNFQRA